MEVVLTIVSNKAGTVCSALSRCVENNECIYAELAMLAGGKGEMLLENLWKIKKVHIMIYHESGAIMH